MLGKKLYKSGALIQFKLIYLLIAFFLLFNLFVQTLSDPTFVNSYDGKFINILKFHWKFPEEIFVYFITIFIPAIYYSFIRGILFYENGMILNRGLPFFNRVLLYKDVLEYKVIHPKYLLSLKRKDLEEEFVFTAPDIDRVISILDQHSVKGSLGEDELKKTMTVNKKMIIIFLCFGFVMFLVQHFGLLGMIFRRLA